MPAAKNDDGHTPTDQTHQLVRLMTSFQIPQDQICGSLGISKRSFHRHYKADVKFGLTLTLTAVKSNLYKTSLGNTRGAVRAGIYLAEKLEAQLRQHHGVDLPAKTYAEEVAASRTVLQITAGAHVPAEPKL